MSHPRGRPGRNPNRRGLIRAGRGGRPRAGSWPVLALWPMLFPEQFIQIPLLTERVTEVQLYSQSAIILPVGTTCVRSRCDLLPRCHRGPIPLPILRCRPLRRLPPRLLPPLYKQITK